MSRKISKTHVDCVRKIRQRRMKEDPSSTMYVKRSFLKEFSGGNKTDMLYICFILEIPYLMLEKYYSG